MKQRAPWYLYPLALYGLVALVTSLAQLSEVSRGDPGATVNPTTQRVSGVRPGTPAARAGLRVGERITVTAGLELRREDDDSALLRWLPGARSGTLLVEQSGRTSTRTLQRRPAPLQVRVAWTLITLTHVVLGWLALGLMWQLPRDSRAVLLALVLLSAHWFFVPVEPRLLPLALLAHLSLIFPTRLFTGWLGRLAVWGLYLAAFVPLFVWAVWRDHLVKGRTDDALGAGVVAAALTLWYAVLPCTLSLTQRWSTLDPARRQAGNLLVACAAIWVATALSIVEALRGIGSGGFPVATLATAVFGVSVFHLLVRLRPLEVRFLIRRSAQYALARWALLLSLAVPVILFAHRLGHASAPGAAEPPGWWAPYFLWGMFTLVVWRYRNAALRALDRQFFPESYEAHRMLLELSEQVSGGIEPDAIGATLCEGVRRALSPDRVEILPPDAALPEDAYVTPLQKDSQVLGYLALGAKRDGLPYTVEERRLLEVVATHAALALDNARLYAALRERDRREVELRSQAVLEGAEEERRRLAADLHDQVLPELRQIADEIERLRRTANGNLPPGDAARLTQLEQEVRGTAGSVREVMEALSPSTLHVLGLGDAVEAYLRARAARREAPLPVLCRRSRDEPDLGPERSLTVFRICQEAVNNLIAHSDARRATFETEIAEGTFYLRLRDDGVGLPPQVRVGARGLENMGYRAELIGASITWSGTPGGGTTVEICCPIGSGGQAELPSSAGRGNEHL